MSRGIRSQHRLTVVLILSLATGCDAAARLAEELGLRSDPTATRAPVELLLAPQPPGGDGSGPARLEEAAAVVRRRLHRMNRRAEVIVAEGRLRVVLAPGVPARMLAGLPALLGKPMRIGFHEVDDHALCSAGRDLPHPVRLEDDGNGCSAVTADRASAQAAVQALQARLPSHLTAAAEPPKRPGEAWRVLALRPAAMGGEAIADARASRSEGNPAVMLEFTPEGAPALKALTRRLVGRRLAITMDDRILSAPYVTAAIPDGRMQITFGTAQDPAVQLEEAADLEVAFKMGTPLPVALEPVGQRTLTP